MTTTILKRNITDELNKIQDENFLKAVYTIVANKADESEYELTDFQRSELDKRRENHKKGISKSYSWQTVRKNALKKK